MRREMMVPEPLRACPLWRLQDPVSLQEWGGVLLTSGGLEDVSKVACLLSDEGTNALSG